MEQTASHFALSLTVKALLGLGFVFPVYVEELLDPSKLRNLFIISLLKNNTAYAKIFIKFFCTNVKIYGRIVIEVQKFQY